MRKEEEGGRPVFLLAQSARMQPHQPQAGYMPTGRVGLPAPVYNPTGRRLVQPDAKRTGNPQPGAKHPHACPSAAGAATKRLEVYK